MIVLKAIRTETTREQDQAMQLTEAKVADLKADPKNRRLHDDASIEAIAESLRRFGQQKPIVVTKANVVIAGNGLLEAAIRLGLETVQVVVTSLKGKDLERFAIADNRTGDMSDWDFDGLLVSLHDLEGDLPGADADWLNEIEAIVTGGKFEPATKGEVDEATERTGATIKVMLASEEHLGEAKAAIQAVVDGKPEWKATVIGAAGRLAPTAK